MTEKDYLDAILVIMIIQTVVIMAGVYIVNNTLNGMRESIKSIYKKIEGYI